VTPKDKDGQHRLKLLEGRVERLEAELQGLQDALYRQSRLEDQHISELRRRTEPEQIARDLSDHARKHGL
jgi:hypothetical protein